MIYRLFFLSTCVKILPYFLLGSVSQLAIAASPCASKSNLPELSGNVISVQSESELQIAISGIKNSTTVLLKPGSYKLSHTLYITADNITLRGEGNYCGDVMLVGNGMENAEYGNVPHGIWSKAKNLRIENLTIKNFYYHGIILNAGAQSPVISSVQIFDTGQQLIKVNPTAYGIGVDNGVVVNSLLAYTNGTPATDHGAGIGYTNGIDVHAGENWRISGNRFENFHTPDLSAWWWNPVILMWNGAKNSIVENNVFVDVDRAIAFGLTNKRSQGSDHHGGVIRNNMIYLSENLMSDKRTSNSDALILVWNSPNTVVVHNTVLANDNVVKSIEFRFDTTGARAINNLVDLPIGRRNLGEHIQLGNYIFKSSAIFENTTTGELKLLSTASAVIDQVDVSEFAPLDFYNKKRFGKGLVDIGAHEVYGGVVRSHSSTNLTVN